jgi:nucleotide-binding universal stress UspA family protein
MRRILACVDLSESSALVLGCARGLCDSGGELVILHVAAPEPDFIGYGVGPQSVRDAVALELRQEHRQVQQMARDLEAPGLAVTPLTVQGAVAEKIIEHAERLAVDFIVLGAAGHGRLHDLIVGSALRGVIKGASTPVVLVPLRAAAPTTPRA